MAHHDIVGTARAWQLMGSNAAGLHQPNGLTLLASSKANKIGHGLVTFDIGKFPITQNPKPEAVRPRKGWRG